MSLGKLVVLFAARSRDLEVSPREQRAFSPPGTPGLWGATRGLRRGHLKELIRFGAPHEDEAKKLGVFTADCLA